MMTRRFWMLMHRYVGLAMALLLILVGLTGSVLAFYQELDRWFNPELLTVPVRDAPMLDPFTLGERAESLEPHARANYLKLNGQPGEAYGVWMEPKIDSATGEAYPLSHDEFFLDPYTGETLGTRKWGEVSLAKENLLPFLYRLHYSLALPEVTGSIGGYILGIMALIWTLDCFIGFYLTLPSGRRRPPPNLPLRNGEAPPPDLSLRKGEGSRYKSPPCEGGNRYKSPPCEGGDLEGVRQRTWWPRWKPAWLIKRSRLNYDLHRASGLWGWPMLFVFAWSSVALNLNEVYSPVMKSFFTFRNAEDLPELDPPLESPVLGWREAYAQGRRLMQEAAIQHGFTVEREQSLSLDREHGVYYYQVRGSHDLGTNGNTSVRFDANTGALKQLNVLGLEPNGDVVTRWLVWLHTARVFGLPMQIFVCVMGLIIAALSVTGVIIWLRKRRAVRHRRSRQNQPSFATATEV